MTSIRAAALVVGLTLTIGTSLTVSAQRGRGGPPAGPRNGTIERITAGGKDISIYVPPSYATDAMRRFPVFYLLTEKSIESLRLQEGADKLASAQGFSEPLVVVVNASGDAEKFVADDLVASIDGKYRTISARISRGLAGYSNGGDAALRVAMKRPDVFSSLYLLSGSVEPSAGAIESGAANLKRLYMTAIAVGTKDSVLNANRQVHDAMTRLKIPHYYEEFDGSRDDRIGELMQTRVLTFFSRNLKAPANPTSPAVN
jgi:enterochelin esterase-like enzyme